MRFFRSTLFLALVTSLTMPCLRAQVGIYGTVGVTHVSDPSSTGSPNAWLYGPSAGVYYDFIHLGPASLGVDLRGNLQYGSNNQRFRSGLFGVRVAVKPPLLPFRPYVQGSVGVGGPGETGFHGVGIAYNNKLEYEVLGGVDITILPHLDWRAVEVGYGRISGLSTSVVSVGSGLVLRLP